VQRAYFLVPYGVVMSGRRPLIKGYFLALR